MGKWPGMNGLRTAESNGADEFEKLCLLVLILLPSLKKLPTNVGNIP